MHTAGFWHEHSREDRDKYITVIWDNMKDKSTERNFKLRRGDEARLFGKYDLCSVLHYCEYCGSCRGCGKVIEPKNPNHGCKHIGQREGFSPEDISKIRKYYECSKDSGEVTSPGYPNNYPNYFNDNIEVIKVYSLQVLFFKI